MPTPPRRLILANGEQYVAPVEKKAPWGPSELPRSYPEARDLVRADVSRSLEKFGELPSKKRFKDEVILTLRLHPDATAKTYDPAALFAVVPDLQNVGSRNYSVGLREVALTKRIKKQIEEKHTQTSGRMVFVRSTASGFQRLVKVLDTPETDLPQAFRDDIRRIEHFNILRADEQLQAFKLMPDWKGGRVELVAHPSRHSGEEVSAFLKHLFRGGGSGHNFKIYAYPNGPTFASCHLSVSELSEIADANPLRAAHPLNFTGLQNFRSAPTVKAPPPPVATTRSTVRVGIFDGGVDVTHPHLRGHVDQDNGLSIKTTADPDGVAHGTAVAGTVLYGPLNHYDANQPLPTPPVSVVSIRALPTSNAADPDLYESIDVIEAAVPARPDVAFWNVSFGPRGPILDDTVSRFTYVLDSLAVTHRVGFCVAVGNDGTQPWELNRVQSPADMVNGLGVGSFTERKGKLMHAPYSCSGPGRECGKLKPDLVAFGGCDHTPFHFLSTKHGEKTLLFGTSLSSPIVTSMGAQAQGVVERGTALLARTLLVHTAKHPTGEPDYTLGHGMICSSFDELVRCGEKEVTVVFQGDILATRYVRLPLMLPPGVVASGTVQITWTVGALPSVSPNHPGDYTNLCIEDTFYPHTEVYSFQNPKAGEKPPFKSLHTKDDAAEIASLTAQGWKRSKFPVSKSGNVYATEHQKRALDYKWEPLVRRVASMRATSLHDPFLVLHAIPRHNTSGRLSYAAAVTISAPKFAGDLYDAVLRRYTALQPIRLRTETEIRIKI